MVKVSIEVHSETARFAVAVQAKSIARVKFPIDPEGFSLEYSAGVGRGG